MTALVPLCHPSGSDHTFLRQMALIAVVSLIYCWILWSGLVAEAGFVFRYDSIWIPFGIAAVFFLAARSQRLANPLLLLLSTGTCGAVLSGVWNSGVSDLSLLAGFFPHSDSFSYLNGGVRLLNGAELFDSGSRRPLTSGIWSVMLFVCQGNMRVMLALVVFICALALVLPARELIRTHGWLAGFMMYLALFLFYRRYIGTTLSEHAGLFLGCLGFTLLWRSIDRPRMILVLAGVFAASLALCVRAGAFFILPALAVWGGWRWRGPSRFSLKIFALVCVAAGTGIAVNSALLYSVGNPRAAMGNFSYVFYGLISGGDWTQVLEDHPGLRLLPEIERNRAIKEMALKKVREHPSTLVKGVLRAYGHFFFSSNGPFSFVRFALQRASVQSSPGPNALGNASKLSMVRAQPWKYIQIAATFATFFVLSGLALVGVYALFRSRPPEYSLLLSAGLGILASVPFVPPWDADLMRIHAATLPFFLVFPALGLATIGVLVFNRLPPAPSWSNVSNGHAKGLLLLTFVIVPLVCLAPILFQFPLLKAAAPKQNTDENKQGIWTLRILPGSLVRVASNRRHWMPAPFGARVEADAARRNMGVFAMVHSDRAAEFSTVLETAQVLALGYEERTGTLRFLTLDNTFADRLARSSMRVCVEPVLSGDEPMWWRLHPKQSGCDAERP